MSLVVTLEGVTKSFRGIPVLKGVDLDLHSGECLAVTGGNGSGKSVLFRLACRLMAPDSGRVVFGPEYDTRGNTFPVGFGAIIDRPGFVASRTGLQNLKDLAAIRAVVSETQIRDAMRRVGLDPDLTQPAGRYSMGMKQKLALAQAFMEGQSVLILDEPFNALDEHSVALVRSLLAELLVEGCTVMFTSHNPEDVAALATRHVRLVDGQITGV